MAEVNYKVRNMTEEDIPQILDVWRETGMHQGTRTLHTWLAVDPEGFKIAVTDDGKVLGSCGAIIQDEDLAFVGLYCVTEKYRARGIGIKIWNACMEHIGDMNVSLNAVPDKTELYRFKGGFPILEPDWVCVSNETKSAVQPENLSDTPPRDVDIVPQEDSHLPLIYGYDQKLIGYDRKLALELNCKEQDSKTFVALRGGECVGFGTIKMSCQDAGLVGPLYADDKDIAEVILRRLIVSLPQAKGFAMFTASCNGPANEFVRRVGCPAEVEFPRLYRKKKVDVDLTKVFAYFDLNFSPY